MAVSSATGNEFPGVFGRSISTELSVTAFQLAGGVFGGIAALIASRRLEDVGGTIPLGRLALPVAVAGVSTVVGAFLLPSE
jgi:hypothetical protein